MTRMPQPVDGVDYFADNVRRYTVTIECEINGFEHKQSHADICNAAVTGFKAGTIDGTSEITRSHFVKSIEVDAHHKRVFNREAWQTAAMKNMGLKVDGTVVRPADKKRPKTEKTLGFFCGDE